MRYIIVFLLIYFQYLHAIDIKVQPDKNIQVLPSDVFAMKNFLKKKYHFIATNDDGVRKLVKENRILANEYLKAGKLNMNLLKVELEKRFADAYVRDLQKKIKIPQKVLKSYYYDHLKEFKQSPKVEIVRYSFNTYENAEKFYRQFKNNKQINVSDFNGTEKDIGIVDLDRVREPLKGLAQEYKKGYVSPPYIWSKDRYDVYYIKNFIKRGKYKKFDEVKEDIKKILYDRTFVKEREKIISSHMDKNK